jgi:hypothetical protein
LCCGTGDSKQADYTIKSNDEIRNVVPVVGKPKKYMQLGTGDYGLGFEDAEPA